MLTGIRAQSYVETRPLIYSWYCESFREPDKVGHFPPQKIAACLEKIFTELGVIRNTSLAALVGTALDKLSLLCAKGQ